MVSSCTEDVKRLEVGGLPQMQTQAGAALVVLGPAVVEDSRWGVRDDPAAVVAVENIVVVATSEHQQLIWKR